MAIKIIMGITNIILILAFYYVTTPAVDKRRSKYFGISVDISNYSEISKLVEKYKRSNKNILYLLLLLVLDSFFYSNSTYILLTHVLVFIVGFIGFYVNMIKYTMQFDDIVLSKDEIIGGLELKKTRKVDLYLSSKADAYKFTNMAYNLFFPLIICIYMIVRIINLSDPNSIEYSIKVLYIIMLVVNLIFLISSILASRYIKDSRQIVFTENTDENILINFKRKNSVINVIYLINNMNIIANFVFVTMFIKSTVLSIAVLILVSILTLFLILYVYKKMKNNDSYIDEDNLGNWIYGIIYYNKANTKLMVPQRFGIGTTINMAKPMGKFIGIASVCFVVILYLYMGYTIIGNDIVDSKMMISNDMVYISSLDYSNSVNLNEIESVELTSSDKVDVFLKTNGIANERYSRGYFDVNGLGNCFLCTYESSDLLILIKSKKGNILYSEKNLEETKETYNNLIKQTK